MEVLELETQVFSTTELVTIYVMKKKYPAPIEIKPQEWCDVLHPNLAYSLYDLHLKHLTPISLTFQ
jgi:hypothetical protein